MSVGLVAGERFTASELLPYVIAQVVGGFAGAAVLYVIASGKVGFAMADGFASNGYGADSPGGYSLLAGFLAEFVLTIMFLLIILGATDKRAPQGFAPIAIGLGLTLIHWIGIPVTNLSVNPARSTGPAIFVGSWAMAQFWLFWIAPILARPSGVLCIDMFSHRQRRMAVSYWLSGQRDADLLQGTRRLLIATTNGVRCWVSSSHTLSDKT